MFIVCLVFFQVLLSTILTPLLRPFKKRQPKLVEEPSLVNEEVEKKKKEMAHVGDLRKHLNSGKIDLVSFSLEHEQ